MASLFLFSTSPNRISLKRGQTLSAKIQGGGGKYKSKGGNPILMIGKANC